MSDAFETPAALGRSETGQKKPCIALMGEFSAGKSTLSNLLIGESPLPVKVTATQLPPVRISHGTDAPWREAADGTIHPIDLGALSEISPADTRLVQIFVEADLLELCDLIDMPGISDPNMDSEVWEGVIGEADGVIWCTHATQAWRQSEAAVWEGLCDRLSASSLLLLTRFDKIVTENDRARVLQRITRETEGLFAEIYPISLTEAVEGRNDWELWERSGAEAFSQGFVHLLNALQGGARPEAPSRPAPAEARPSTAAPQTPSAITPASNDGTDGVRPRRVKIDRDRGRRARPDGSDSTVPLLL